MKPILFILAIITFVFNSGIAQQAITEVYEGRIGDRNISMTIYLTEDGYGGGTYKGSYTYEGTSTSIYVDGGIGEQNTIVLYARRDGEGDEPFATFSLMHAEMGEVEGLYTTPEGEIAVFLKDQNSAALDDEGYDDSDE